MSQQHSEKALVTFRDVAVCFSEEEWKILQEWQKELYKNMMKEIHQALISLGYKIINPEILLRVNKGDEVYAWDPQDPGRGAASNDPSSSCHPVINPEILLRIQHEEEMYGRDPCSSEETAVSHRNSTASVCSFIPKEEDEVCVMDHQDSERSDSSACYSTEHVVTSFIVKEDDETGLLGHQDSERRDLFNMSIATEHVITSFIIKEEDDTCSLDDQDSETRSIFNNSSVKVTLDPDTASRWLILSEHGQRVSWGDTGPTLPRNPKRFTSDPCVLGNEGFSSGKHYWEVQLLQEGGGWYVGATRESVSRKRRVTLSPERGVWAVEGCKGQYWALTSPRSSLSLRERPSKLGVYLDYEAGLLSLHNADTMEHLYTFTSASFTKRVFPFFCLWAGAELRLV